MTSRDGGTSSLSQAGRMIVTSGGTMRPLNAPSPMRTIPFQPGCAYKDPTRKRFAKSHLFEFKVGVGRDLGAMPTEVDPLERVITSNNSKFNVTQGAGQFEDDFSQQATFVPSFVGLDGKVLRFIADMTESVPEAFSDNMRDRRFTILYYLVDDSMQIVEQRRKNSGYIQGIFMKRHKVPRAASASAYNESDFVSLHDFADTDQVVLYGRIFRLIGCNQFTKEFYELNHLPLKIEALMPEQPTSPTSSLKAGSVSFSTSAPGRRQSQMVDDFDTAKLKPNQRAGYKREKFLKFNNKVLRFYAIWDDRKSMFGDKRSYVVNFYLADDAVEVLERYGSNEGRDPFPKLVKKSKIPKKFHGVTGIGVSVDDISDKIYIRDTDLFVGGTIEIYGRRLFLYDCDDFTRHFYRTAYGREQPPPCQPAEELIEFPLQQEPPYTGFGTEEDSIASFYRLVPRPRAFDSLKQEELDKIIFRWKAKFDMDAMEHAGPDDSKRRFVISFYMSDSTIAIYEPPVSNSGFIGGKFLERQKIRKHKTTKFDSQYLTAEDLLIDLPGSVWLNKYPFVLLECDRFTLRYRNKGNIASLLSIDSIHLKMKDAINDTEALMYAFREIDEKGTGQIFLDDFVKVLESYDTQLDEDELLAVVQYWDKQQDGKVPYQEFASTISSL